MTKRPKKISIHRNLDFVMSGSSIDVNRVLVAKQASVTEALFPILMLP
jgi:hypothetical protein